jgi:hypothetical protein
MASALTRRRELDARLQVRRFELAPQPPGRHWLKGYSEAQWFRQMHAACAARTPSDGGSLVVRTTQLMGGYLRPNGVPFSERATVKEFFNTFMQFADDSAPYCWLCRGLTRRTRPADCLCRVRPGASGPMGDLSGRSIMYRVGGPGAGQKVFSL